MTTMIQGRIDRMAETQEVGIRATVVADSISEAGHRLTTMVWRYPRFIHSEIMTHRMFCLAGDVELEFDLPAGADGYRRVHRLRLDEFVDKWMYGARRVGAKPKRESDLSWIEDGAEYATVDIAARLGLATSVNINRQCRDGSLAARRAEDGRTWLLKGAEVRRWRLAHPEHTRFDMQARLMSMRIRQLNEHTGDIQTSHVTRACDSGEKEVFEVSAGDYQVAGSADHRVLTADGWKKISELSTKDFLIVRKFGKFDDDKKDPLRLKKIGGVWRSKWQAEAREKMFANSVWCRRCGTRPGVDIHHIVPVHEDQSRAFDSTNITFLCQVCHDEMHSTQGWQGDTYLYGAAAQVTEIVSRGVERTFDLEIAGAFPNFLANGVVVHNSRNAASSRAIPVEKMISQVLEDPAMPVYWGKNQSGMQAREELSGQVLDDAKANWLYARDRAVDIVKDMHNIGLHKQIANRILEPWMVCLVTATEWANFFHLRCHPDAQPEFQALAKAALAAMNESNPILTAHGGYHLPFITDEEKKAASDADDLYHVINFSIARCARVSYLNHDNTNPDPREGCRPRAAAAGERAHEPV